jgi:hypothetical protein
VRQRPASRGCAIILGRLATARRQLVDGHRTRKNSVPAFGVGAPFRALNSDFSHEQARTGLWPVELHGARESREMLMVSAHGAPSERDTPITMPCKAVPPGASRRSARRERTAHGCVVYSEFKAETHSLHVCQRNVAHAGSLAWNLLYPLAVVIADTLTLEERAAQMLKPRPRQLPIAPHAPPARRQLPLAGEREKDRAYQPIYAVWEITLKCDLACRHCGSRAGHERSDELTTAECLDLVRQMAELGVRETTLIGGEAYLRDGRARHHARARASGEARGHG